MVHRDVGTVHQRVDIVCRAPHAAEFQVAGDAGRNGNLQRDPGVLDRISDPLDQGARQLIYPVGKTWIVRDHAREFIAAKAREQRIARQDRADAIGGGAQKRIAGLMAVEVVDRLEVVEIDHDEGYRPAVPTRRGQKGGGFRADAAPVESPGQRIGFGELAREFFRLATFGYLPRKLGMAAPAENHERDVEQQGRNQKRVGRGADAHPGSHDLRQDHSAGADEEQDRRNGDAQCNHVAFGAPDGWVTGDVNVMIHVAAWHSAPRWLRRDRYRL